MPLYTCQICGKSYTRRDALTRHMNVKHPKYAKDGYDSDDEDDLDDKDEVKDIDNGQLDNDNVKKTKRYDVFGQLRCHKCGQIFGSQELLEHHLRKKNHGFEQFPCAYCTRVFPTQKMLDDHYSKEHKIKEKDLVQCKSSVIFHHPFTMIVAGPTRSGKTTWVARLLQNRLRQIIPTPSRIIYCFVHEQPMYEELKRLMPFIEFYDAMPTEETFAEFSDSLVILDDMIDSVVNDSSMMKVFTERSHHQNISVIFMTQNIFHQGKTARTISLNTQYMVLFENARDRQQIKTLAKQMYPDKWMSFMDRFKKETAKPYGRMIVDLRPGIAEKDRFLTDNDCPQIPMSKQDERVKQHGEGRGILEMDVVNLKRALPHESGSQLDMNSSEYILAPKSVYQQKMKIDTADVLQSIKQPEQREMIKRYSLAQNMLRDPNVDMNEYREAIQDFSLLKDRQIRASLPQPPPVKKQRENDEDDIDESVIDTLPENQQVSAKKIMRVLRSHGNDLVSWTADGDVSIQGEPLKRVNFTDLLSGVVRSRPSKNIPPPYEKFLKALAEANIPESIIKNKTALNQYRAIKRDNEVFNNEVSSTAGAHQDRGIRSKLRSIEWEAPT